MITITISVSDGRPRIPSLRRFDPILASEILKVTQSGSDPSVETRTSTQIRRGVRNRTARNSWVDAGNLIIGLGSAGAFSALYQVLCKYIDKDKTRSITIETKSVKLTLTGHSRAEEKAMLELLFPELRRKQRNFGRTRQIGPLTTKLSSSE